MDSISFTAYGIPAPKGSTKAFMPKRGRYPVVTETNEHTRPWVNVVKGAALDAVRGSKINFPRDPVKLFITFWMPRPISLPKKVTHHIKKPDLDKLTRAICDALTGIVWNDDSQVVRIDAVKRYVTDGCMPKAVIIVEGEN